MLQTSKSKFSRSSVSPICKCCGLDNEDLPHMLLECPALINQKKSFYPEFKSMTIDIVGINQWNKRYTSRTQFSRPLIAQDKLFHRQNAVRNFLIPST